MLFRLVEMKMSKIYNNAFKVGFLCNILLFVVLNTVSRNVSYNEYINSGTYQSHFGEYSWGFPFEMYRYYPGYFVDGFTPKGVILNTFVIGFCGFVVGLLFKFIWSKLSSRHSPLK